MYSIIMCAESAVKSPSINPHWDAVLGCQNVLGCDHPRVGRVDNFHAQQFLVLIVHFSNTKLRSNVVSEIKSCDC